MLGCHHKQRFECHRFPQSFSLLLFCEHQLGMDSRIKTMPLRDCRDSLLYVRVPTDVLRFRSGVLNPQRSEFERHPQLRLTLRAAGV